MSNLGQRIITAIVLLVAAAAALFVLPPIAGLLFIGFFLVVGCWEWSGFFGRSSVAVRGVFLLACVGLLYPVWAVEALGIDSRVVAAIGVAWWLIVLGRAALGRRPFHPVFIFVAGLICLFPAWMALLEILRSTTGAWLLVWLLAMVAAADIGAYFTGKAFGRHKLAPAISPGKTIEGLGGGLIVAALAGAAGGWLLGQGTLLFLLVGALIALISVVGDLSISAFKRNAGLKDSGHILPGHGGVLDRVDGLLAASPAWLLVLGATELLPVG